MKSMISLFFILIIINHCDVISGDEGVEYCPDDCSNIDCLPVLNMEMCPEGTVYRENIILGGCCPACVSYLDLDEECELSVQDYLTKTEELSCSKQRTLKQEFIEIETENKNIKQLIPHIKLMSCRSGTKCDNGVCQVDNNNDCISQLNEYNVWAANKDCFDMFWEPNCDYKGSFAKVQSRSNWKYSENPKFCSDPNGVQIYGMAVSSDDSMNCECSRKRWLLEQSRSDVTIHCSPNGNYEIIQCDDGRCWCIDDTKLILPETLISQLPCFDESKLGNNYLRRCEQSIVYKKRAIKMFKEHGLTWNPDMSNECDWNGGYGPVKCSTEPIDQCQCVDNFGVQIENYHESPSEDFDCRCARESGVFGEKLDCTNAFGAYEIVQFGQDSVWCVDEFGFQITMSYQKTWYGFPCEIPNCDKRVEYCNSISQLTEHCDECYRFNTCDDPPPSSK